MSTFEVNVAREIEANRGKPFGPYYRHHFRAILGAATAAEAIGQARELAAAFPAPAFKVTLSEKVAYGQGIDFEDPANGGRS